MLAFSSYSAPVAAPERTIHHVFALQRSGHHAVMAWLEDCYRQTGKSTGHLNDVYHGHIPGMDVADPDAEAILHFSRDRDVTFVNYEDLGCRDRINAANYCGVLATQDQAVSSDVVLLRDWYNMAASRLRSIDKAEHSGVKLQLHNLPLLQIMGVWEEYASLHAQQESPVVINYNNWFTMPGYRHAMAARFGLANSDNTLDSVPVFGRGSSFDGMAYMGAGSRMGVLERWKRLPIDQLDSLIELSDSSVMLDGLHRYIFGFGQKEVKQFRSMQQQ